MELLKNQATANAFIVTWSGNLLHEAFYAVIVREPAGQNADGPLLYVHWSHN